MRRTLFVAVLVVVLLAVGAVAAFAAPGSPVRGFGMMGGAQRTTGGYGMMGQGGSGMMGGAQGATGGYGVMGQGSAGMMGAGSPMDDALEALGISHAEIHAAHASGKSMVEIAAEKDVTEDQLINALLEGHKKAVAQAVVDGKLTREAADQMTKSMNENIRAMVEAKGMSGMMSAGGMMGQDGANHMGGANHMNGANHMTGANHMNGAGMMGGAQITPDTDRGTSNGSCHDGQAPAQQGTEL